MRPITYVLLTLLALMIGGEILFHHAQEKSALYLHSL